MVGKEMKYNEKAMVIVLRTLHETGLMNEEELKDYIEKTLDQKLEVSTIHLCLRRWKAKSAVVIEEVEGVPRYKIAKIPPWFNSLKMSNLLKISVREAKDQVEELDEFYGAGTEIVQTRGKYKDIIHVKLTFQTVDALLGGLPGKTDKELVLPRKKGKVVIPINWQKGWVRSNAPLFSGTGSMQHHVGMGVGKFEKEITPTEVIAVVKKVGKVKYEAIPEDSVFVTTWHWPTKGTKIKSKAHLKEFLDLLAVDPIRGMGANPYKEGGRVALTKMETLDPPSYLRPT